MIEGKKISELGLVTNINDSCCFPLLSNGATKRITFAVLLENILAQLTIPENQEIKALKEKINNLDSSIELTDREIEIVKLHCEEIQKDVNSQDEIIVKYVKLFEELKEAYDRIEAEGMIIDDELDETSEHAIANKTVAQNLNEKEKILSSINSKIPEQASKQNKLTDKNYVDNEIENIPTVKNFFKTNATRMIAHRGLSSIAPENTIPAYELAGEFGYWGGEVDVQKTKDGHFICIHDGTLDRTTNGTGNIADFTLSEIQKLYTNSLTPFMGNAESLPIASGEAVVRIPTLEEYLEVCKRRSIVPVIELKEETLTASDMPALLEIVDKWQMSEQVVYIAFNECNTNLLEAVHALNPKAYCQPLLNFTKENIDYVAENFAPNCGIDVYYGGVTKELIEYAHSKGVEVNCWTVDNETVKERLMSYGIDYITTNKLINPNLPEMKTGALGYELGGFERTIDAIQKTFELQSDSSSNIIFCENPVVGCHNLFDPSTIEQSEAGTTPYSRAILTYFNKNNVNYSKIRAIDKTKYYLNEKTVYVGGIDYDTYKVTLIPFNEKGLFITDLGWFTARCFVALPDRTSFVLFYFARVDGGDITDTDLVALKSAYISRKQPRRYVIPNSDFTFVTKLNDNLSALGKTELSLSEMTAGFISSEPTARCWSFKGENVFGYTRLKFHYLNTDYAALAYCFKKNNAGKLVYTKDLYWAEDGIELNMPNKTERIYFAFKKADGSIMTRKDLTSIHNCVVVEIY